MRRRRPLFAFVVLCKVIFFGVVSCFAQVNTATLTGLVSDPQGLAVRGAKITLTSEKTGTERSGVSDESGRYRVVGLTPGEYKVRVEGPSTFAPYENPALQVTVGQEAILNVTLTLGTQQQTVTVTTETAPIETTRSESAQTVGQRQINNLPINGRNYINFTLLNSQTTRDVAPTIGPAPNSGLNISGSRARSNMVSVDGADFGDNSIDGVRTTLSQEGVQEFQMILSNYNAEYGRATGGVVNIVTKGGTNEFHGNVFGFLRNSAFQARNPFSGEVNAAGALVPVKQAYTRVQTGVTVGGPIKKDKTFYFFSYEYTQREETGFSSIGQNNFGLQTVNVPTGPTTFLPVQLTQDQASAVNTLLSTQNPALVNLASQYGILMGSASSVALNRFDYGAVAPALTSGVVNPGPGAQFPVPITCPILPAGEKIGTVNCANIPVNPLDPNYSYGVASLPSSFVGLNALRGNFPTSEKTSLWSARLDHVWNSKNNSFLRVGVAPSYVTGIQTTAQNQVFGQNSGSRVGVNWLHDLNATFQTNTVASDTLFNEFRFQFARRSNYFGYSNLEGGAGLGVNIPGYAYFGREPYSTVNRVEKRFQITDNVTWTHGRHTFKFGADTNIILLRSSNSPQIFELDFGGVANFGGIAASTFGLPDCINLASGPHNGACSAGEIVVPGATALQAYGLGDPTTYIQGIGSSNTPFDNIPFGFFAQDSWKITPKITLNYGLRYDVEITPLFAPATQVNAAAEKALGVIEGIPRDYHNVAPRIGLAWDPKGDGKTVVRASYGIFYDHPLLAIAFDSVTADGGRSVQLLSTGGAASACGVLPAIPAVINSGYPLCYGGLDMSTNLNGSSIFQGVLNATPNMFYQANQQRFNPVEPTSLFANQNFLPSPLNGTTGNPGFPLPILPFTLPVQSNFQYGYAQQVNLTVEHVIAGNWTLSVGYQGTRGLHLYRPVDINSTDPVLLTNNLLYSDAAGLHNSAGLPYSNPLTVALPSADVSPTANNCGLTMNPALNLVPGVLGVLAGCPATGKYAGLDGKFVGTPAFFNYFRPSGPNPSYAGFFPGGYGTQVALAQAAGFPTGFGVPVPFNSVDAQESTGASWYNALTINVSKHFSRHFELLSSYTWSHSIDNSTDLQSPLEPQDDRFPYLEKANSVNDQRHRWVTSGVIQTSPHQAGEGFLHTLLSNFTFAPLIELSSGRPFNVITGNDLRLDFSASGVRPDASGSTASPYIHGVSFGVPQTCLTDSKEPFSVAGIAPFYGCIGNLGRDKFTMPFFFQFDLRVAKAINLGERFRLDLIADAFNLTNHTNMASVNQLCDPTSGTTCLAGQPTAAYDARQLQFALKFNW
jgi:hypothetical protein